MKEIKKRKDLTQEQRLEYINTVLEEKKDKKRGVTSPYEKVAKEILSDMSSSIKKVFELDNKTTMITVFQIIDNEYELPKDNNGKYKMIKPLTDGIKAIKESVLSGKKLTRKNMIEESKTNNTKTTKTTNVDYKIAKQLNKKKRTK